MEKLVIRALGALGTRWERTVLPPALQAADAPVEERRRARVFLWTTTVVSFGVLLVWVMNRTIGRPLDAAELTSEALALGLLGLLPLLRRGVSAEVLAQVLAAVLVSGLFLPIWTTQGRAPATLLISLLPPMMVVMTGARSAFCWSVIVVAGLVAMAVASGLRPDHEIPIPARVQERWIFTIPCVLVALQTTLIALLEAHRNRAQAELESSRRAFRAIFESAPVGIGLFDADGSALQANPRAREMLGMAPDEPLRPEALFRAIHPDDEARASEYFRRGLGGAEEPPLVYRWVRPGGRVEWVEGATSAVRDAEGRVQYVVGTAQFVTERKTAEEKIKALAFFDGITGLANRSLFVQRLDVALDVAKKQDHDLAVLFLDLDGFKQVNDRFGHDAGDDALAQVAARFASCVRLSDQLGRMPDKLHLSRFGGDEFAVLLTKVEGREGAEVVARRMIASLRDPLRLGEHELALGVSIGIAVHPKDGDSVEALLRNADAAMYRAKTEPGSAYRFHEEPSRAAG